MVSRKATVETVLRAYKGSLESIGKLADIGAAQQAREAGVDARIASGGGFTIILREIMQSAVQAGYDMASQAPRGSTAGADERNTALSDIAIQQHIVVTQVTEGEA